MNPILVAWVALGAPFLLNMLPAQARQPRPLGLREACGLQRLDGELWGIGPDYRVAFRTDGVEFTPALGKRAPRNYPLTLRLVAVGRGDERHPVARAEPRQHDLQVRYDRGAVVERYDVSSRGIEQSFVFAERPTGSGDLVVQLALTTELPLVRQEASGLRFELPDLGGVAIGGVTGIDAKDRRAPGTITCNGTTIELRLPQHFVDSASFPLVLDPPIGAVFAVTNSAADYEDPELSAPVTTPGNSVCAFTFALSASDHDIRAIQVSSFGSTVGGVVAVTTGADDDQNPTIGFVALRDAFVIAYERGGNVYARSLTVPTSGAPVIGAEATAAQGPDTQIEPDLGSETTDDDNDAVLVFRNATQATIQAVQLSVTTTGAITAFGQQTIGTAPPLHSIERPRIAHGGGDAGRFLVCHSQTSLIVGSDTKQRLTLIDRNLVVLDAMTLTGTTNDEDDADVDGNGDRWLVVFESEASEGSGDNDIVAVTVAYDELQGTLAAGNFHPSTTTPNVDDLDPVVAWFRNGSCLLAWRKRASPGSGNTDVYMKTLDQVSGGWCEAEIVLASTGSTETNPTAAAHPLQDGLGLVLWETSIGNGDIDGIAWDAADGIHATPFGAGICNAPPVNVAGCVRNVNLSHRHEVHGIAEGTPTLLVLSFSASWITCGTCRLYANPYEGVLLPAVAGPGGVASVYLPILGFGLEGTTFHAQWLVHNAAPGATCSWLQADLSNPLSLTIE